MLRGLWIDDAPTRVLGPGYLGELQELGVQVAAIMVETSSRAWDPTWTEDQATRAAIELIGHDIEPVITTWPVPSRGYIDAMSAWLERVAPAGVAAVEGDLEHLWKKRYLRGFASMNDAAVYLVHRLRTLADRFDLRLEVTTHPWHGESSPRALVAPHVHRIVDQAYSVRKRPDGTLIAWDDRKLGPGHHQRWTAADAQTVPGVVEGRVQLALGLPAWSQIWPGHAPSEAMQTAQDAAASLGVVEARWWSSKHVLGAVANGYAAAWMRATAG